MLTKGDVRSAVQDEFREQLPEWTRVITESVTKALGQKIDAVYTKLDSFIGDIKARREEDALHQQDHDRLNERVDRLEKHADLPSLP